MIISGRKGFGAEINGIYKRSNAIHDERPTFTKAGAKGTRLFIYYHLQNKAWALADVIGSSAILGYSSSGGVDTQLPCQTKTAWKITDAQGRFLEDTNLTCKAEEIVVSPFSAALRRKQEVNICRTPLSTEQVSELCTELRQNECIIRRLKLFENNLSAAMIKMITSAVKFNKTLTHFQLRSNNVADETADFLADMIACNTTLQLVSFRDNSIGDAGFMRIADALKSNRTLSGLSMWSNEADTIGISHLIECLKLNKTLQGLRITGNRMSVPAMSKLAQRAKQLSSACLVMYRNY